MSAKGKVKVIKLSNPLLLLINLGKTEAQKKTVKSPAQ